MKQTVSLDRKYPWRWKVLALAVSVALAWVCAETMLAALGLPSDEMVFLDKDGSLQWDCYCSNPRGYFVERPLGDGRTVYCVDHSDDPPRIVDFSDPQLSNAYKIITVGDSFTWGLGVKGHDVYPVLVQQMLEESTAKQVVVSNYANVGRMITEIHEEMRQAVAAGAPDLCIYGFVLNDPLDASRRRTQPVSPTEKAPGMESDHIYDGINVRTANLERFRLETPGARLRQVSRVLDLALRRWEWRRIERQTLQFYRDLYDPAQNARGLQVTTDALFSMKRLQENHGAQFLIVVFPMFVDVDGDYPFADLHHKVGQWLTGLEIDYLDLLEVYRGHPTESLWVHPLDRHPNDVAHRIAAEAISQFVVEKGWLQRNAE